MGEYSGYIEGLKKALEVLEQSHEADCLEMEDLPEKLSGAKRAIDQAKILVADEIETGDIVRLTERGGIDMTDPLPAVTDDGVTGYIRKERPESMELDNGLYFIPIKHDAELHRGAFAMLLEAIDNHYPDSPKSAELYNDAKKLIGE